MQSNEQVFSEYIKSRQSEAIATAWVLWMLQQLEEKRDVSIDPEELRISMLIGYDLTPP